MTDSLFEEENSSQSLDEKFNQLPLAVRIERMHSLVMEALEKVYRNELALNHADRYAALALHAQMELARFLSQVQFNAKQAKHAVKYSTADISFELRSQSDKKLTEEAIKQGINRDIRIKEADQKQAELEREAEQWGYVFESLQNAHIFFRNLGK